MVLFKHYLKCEMQLPSGRIDPHLLPSKGVTSLIRRYLTTLLHSAPPSAEILFPMIIPAI